VPKGVRGESASAVEVGASDGEPEGGADVTVVQSGTGRGPQEVSSDAECAASPRRQVRASTTLGGGSRHGGWTRLRLDELTVARQLEPETQYAGVDVHLDGELPGGHEAAWRRQRQSDRHDAGGCPVLVPEQQHDLVEDWPDPVRPRSRHWRSAVRNAN
jgi:hypothetical protein